MAKKEWSKAKNINWKRVASARHSTQTTQCTRHTPFNRLRAMGPDPGRAYVRQKISTLPAPFLIITAPRIRSLLGGSHEWTSACLGHGTLARRGRAIRSGRRRSSWRISRSRGWVFAAGPASALRARGRPCGPLRSGLPSCGATVRTRPATAPPRRLPERLLRGRRREGAIVRMKRATAPLVR